jgi:hypothetical protein
VYVGEASSCDDAGLYVGDFHIAIECFLFPVMVQCSPVVGGTGILEEHWYQQIRVQHGIHSQSALLFIPKGGSSVCLQCIDINKYETNWCTVFSFIALTCFG